jgi:integrase
MKRKFERVPRHPGIYRVLVLNEKNGKYEEPERGDRFAASVEAGWIDGKRKRAIRRFETFAEAKEFRASSSKVKDIVREALKPKQTMTFKQLADRWCADIMPHLERTTQARYRSYLKHFKPLNDVDVEKIDPSAIDAWISFVKRPEYLAQLNVTRCGFDHEFTVLRGILNYYASRFNRNYRLPFLRDHNKMLRVREKEQIRKDLSVEEFKKFLNALKDFLLGTEHEVIYYIALAQYAIYGRIQDAAALHHEDFDFERGKIYIRRKIQWARTKGEVDRITQGSKANGGKEIPMNDFATKVFREWVMKSGVRSGLLFTYRGAIVTYRQIGFRYDQALALHG